MFDFMHLCSVLCGLILGWILNSKLKGAPTFLTKESASVTLVAEPLKTEVVKSEVVKKEADVKLDGLLEFMAEEKNRKERFLELQQMINDHVTKK